MNYLVLERFCNLAYSFYELNCLWWFTKKLWDNLESAKLTSKKGALFVILSQSLHSVAL